MTWWKFCINTCGSRDAVWLDSQVKISVYQGYGKKWMYVWSIRRAVTLFSAHFFWMGKGAYVAQD